MRMLAERVYFDLCRALAWGLRSARYSTVQIMGGDDGQEVRKRRRFCAPLLVWMSGPLITLLDTGVRVLPRRNWEERERRLYRRVYGASIRLDADGSLMLPRFPGDTLAVVLENAALDERTRNRAIEWAVVGLAGLHQQGLTHGDAMAENVLIDLEAGRARWVDFETQHDPGRPESWRRADDVRALMATCLVRTATERIDETVQRIVDAYADARVTGLLPTSFTVGQRPLAFHLAQARFSFRRFREIARVLRGRAEGQTEPRSTTREGTCRSAGTGPRPGSR